MKNGVKIRILYSICACRLDIFWLPQRQRLLLLPNIISVGEE
jgi:hypothetical protein